MRLSKQAHLLKNLIALFLLGIVIIGCSKEQKDNPIESQSATLLAKDLSTSTEMFKDANGLYHGVIAAGYGLERGKIWIYLGKEDKNLAYIELVSGITKSFELTDNTQVLNPTRFVFANNDSRFILDVTDPDNPILEDISLNEELFFARVLHVSDRGPGIPMVYTGTFSDDLDPSFAGTWNLISSGLNDMPNGPWWGPFDESWDSAFVTFNGNMHTDAVFEDFPSDCFVVEVGPIITPQLAYVALGNPDEPSFLIAENQTSTTFGSGTTNWSITTIRGPGVPADYFDFDGPTCFASPIPRGGFNFVSDSGAIIKAGGIYIDDVILVSLGADNPWTK